MKLHIQDLGKENWEDVAYYYVKNNDGIFLVFDSSVKMKVKPYLNFYFRTIHQCNTEIPILVVGNKNDLPVKVNINKIAQYITKLGNNFIQTSAKTGDNVGYAFKLLTSEVIKKKAAAKKLTTRNLEDDLYNIFTRYNL
ncbi:MAG: hypothetical protein ACFFD2_02295 [Promethearchaeota archaeon]